MAVPAIRQPSTSLWGSCRMISLSLQVPGSDSSALTTTYEGLPSEACRALEVLSTALVLNKAAEASKPWA